VDNATFRLGEIWKLLRVSIYRHRPFAGGDYAPVSEKGGSPQKCEARFRPFGFWGLLPLD
jgi:hypothetical protein